MIPRSSSEVTTTRDFRSGATTRRGCVGAIVRNRVRRAESACRSGFRSMAIGCAPDPQMLKRSRRAGPLARSASVAVRERRTGRPPCRDSVGVKKSARRSEHRMAYAVRCPGRAAPRTGARRGDVCRESATPRRTVGRGQAPRASVGKREGESSCTPQPDRYDGSGSDSKAVRRSVPRIRCRKGPFPPNARDAPPRKAVRYPRDQHVPRQDSRPSLGLSSRRLWQTAAL